MEYNLTYTTERYTAEIDAHSYVEQFRNADHFLKFCQQCRNYGRRYGCPPFSHDPLSDISHYQQVRITGVKIVPADKTLPLQVANDLMKPVIDQLNQDLLETEQSLGGMCFGFVGSCPYCGGAACARIEGKPCRHPDKVRPSLEAYGFDMVKTAQELLGLEMKWSQHGRIPEYLTLVCGIFYNKHSDN